MKKILFDYVGGERKVQLDIMNFRLPFTISHELMNWFDVKINCDIVIIAVKPIYDFVDREFDLVLCDANNKEYPIHIKQNGFKGLELYCNSSLVLNNNFFKTSHFYNFYVTVYGGKTQKLVCDKLEKYIDQVWDNSDMYNDFVIRVPEGVVGKFILKHSDYDEYKKYCKDNGVFFDESKVKKEITITQLDMEDKIGYIILKIGDTIYHGFKEINLPIVYTKPIKIKILSTKFLKEKSKSEYEVRNEKEVDWGWYPPWLDVRREGDYIIIKATEKNNSCDRSYALELSNHWNLWQKTKLIIYQKSEKE